MRKETLINSFTPGAAIQPNTIVKHGTTDDEVIPAGAGTDASIGIANGLGADSADDSVDVVISGIAELKIGGTVTRGDPITANASAQGIAATAEGQRIIGFAMESGVSGDIIGCRIAPSVFAVAGSA